MQGARSFSSVLMYDVGRAYLAHVFSTLARPHMRDVALALALG